MNESSSLILAAWKWSADVLQLVGRISVFVVQVLIQAVSPPYYFRELFDFTALVCQRCVFPVLFTMTPFGMVTALHGSGVFAFFSAERMLGFLVGIATFRELAPNLTAMLISAQAGSAFAAELAAMRAQEEIDATEVMGVNPIKIHVVPRVLGVTLASPILTLLGCAGGIGGGYVMAVYMKGQDGSAYLDNLFGALRLFDLTSALIKSTSFGLLIGMLACYLGYHAKGTSQSVGEAVNHTSVYSITLFLLLNYFLSNALFGIVD